ncbi:MAG: MlaD family protein [Bacteroidales bacterium]|jgi:phospholipid/cholesterol/gamma-HCH transport system substrate-binding protein|nr:MlaD family protein [Bacteroidales bacterium]
MGEKKNIFKSTEIKIAVFALAGLFLLIWGINFLKGIDIFKKQYTYHVIFDNASGLTPAHLVTVNGMNVGNVDDIQLVPELSNRVLVTIHVNKEIQIPLHSTIRIVSPDLFSSPQVEILYSGEHQYLQEGDTVWGSISPGIMDGLGDLGKIVSNVDTTMVVVKNLMTSLAIDSLKLAVTNFCSIIQNVDNIVKDNASNVNVAIADIQSFTAMLRENNDNIAHIIEKISTVSDHLAEAEIKHLTDSISILANRANLLVENMNAGKGTLGQLVTDTSLYVNLNNSLVTLERLLEDLKNNPKKYINVTVFGRKEKKEKDKKK